MSLSAEQLRQRDGKVSASFAPALMAGNYDAILSKWRELVGDPEWRPEDFSDNWPVNFGSYIELFALDWHQRKHGQPLTRRGEVVTHPERPWACCTLDAFRHGDGIVLDVKAVGAWRKLDEVIAYYAPQMVMQRDCVGAQGAALLIVHGGAEPQEHPVAITPDYAAQVWERIEWFWRCVQELTPPVALSAVAAPMPAVKEYDMRQSNAWGSEAATWLANRAAAKAFQASEKELKALVPADARRAFGHGLECVRDKAGRLSLKEAK